MQNNDFQTFSRAPRGRVFWLCAGLLSLVSVAQAAPNEERPPNVVLIFADDLGWRDVGFMGSDYYRTPHLDRLARQGMTFTDAYANAPNCAPTRACLMSGQYTPRHGVYTVGTSARGPAHLRKLVPTPNETVLDEEIVTLAESFHKAGYATASMGKWHLGPDPRTQGFDINVAGSNDGSPRGGYFSPYRIPNIEDGPEGEYVTDRLADEALHFIEQHVDEPFFLYLPHFAVHTPIQAKPELTEKYQDQPASHGQHHPAYAAMIESLDESVGRIMARLDELKLADETVVIFCSDNGGHGVVTSNQPLRGWKGMLYEGGIRVPLVVRWPGKVEAGSRSETPVITSDFYPTLLEITGATAPEQPLDGESLLPLLTEQGQLQRTALYWHFPAYLEANRGAKDPWRTTPAGAIREGDWKLIEYFEDGRLELYNLADDLSEGNNLAQSMPERTQQLHQKLKQWRRAIDAPVPSERNPKYNPQAKPQRKKSKKENSK